MRVRRRRPLGTRKSAGRKRSPFPPNERTEMGTRPIIFLWLTLIMAAACSAQATDQECTQQYADTTASLEELTAGGSIDRHVRSGVHSRQRFRLRTSETFAIRISNVVGGTAMLTVELPGVSVSGQCVNHTKMCTSRNGECTVNVGFSYTVDNATMCTVSSSIASVSVEATQFASVEGIMSYTLAFERYQATPHVLSDGDELAETIRSQELLRYSYTVPMHLAELDFVRIQIYAGDIPEGQQLLVYTETDEAIVPGPSPCQNSSSAARMEKSIQWEIGGCHLHAGQTLQIVVENRPGANSHGDAELPFTIGASLVSPSEMYWDVPLSGTIGGVEAVADDEFVYNHYILQLTADMLSITAQTGKLDVELVNEDPDASLQWFVKFVGDSGTAVDGCTAPAFQSSAVSPWTDDAQTCDFLREGRYMLSVALPAASSALATVGYTVTVRKSMIGRVRTLTGAQPVTADVQLPMQDYFQTVMFPIVNDNMEVASIVARITPTAGSENASVAVYMNEDTPAVASCHAHSAILNATSPSYTHRMCAVSCRAVFVGAYNDPSASHTGTVHLEVDVERLFVRPLILSHLFLESGNASVSCYKVHNVNAGTVTVHVSSVRYGTVEVYVASGGFAGPAFGECRPELGRCETSSSDTQCSVNAVVDGEAAGSDLYVTVMKTMSSASPVDPQVSFELAVQQEPSTFHSLHADHLLATGTGDCPVSASGVVCSGNGECVNGRCICPCGYFGFVCERQACPVGENVESGRQLACSGHGACVFRNDTAVCVCNDGFVGPACEVRARSCPVGDNGNECSGRGTCVRTLQSTQQAARCECQAPFAGPSCSSYSCPARDGFACSGPRHGACVARNGSSMCECNPQTLEFGGFFGPICQFSNCTAEGDTLPCSGHGRCLNDSGSFRCLCDAGYNGTFCTQPACPVYKGSMCNAAVAVGATCAADTGSCSCGTSGYTGHDCREPVCPTGANGRMCSGNGWCEDVSGTLRCRCDDTWHGSSCSRSSCPATLKGIGGHTCSGAERGVPAIDERTGDCTCRCHRGWGGANCAEVRFANCTTKDNLLCAGHGECVGLSGEHSCRCDELWHGERCEYSRCGGPRRTECGNVGTCVKSTASRRGGNDTEVDDVDGNDSVYTCQCDRSVGYYPHNGGCTARVPSLNTRVPVEVMLRLYLPAAFAPQRGFLGEVPPPRVQGATYTWQLPFAPQVGFCLTADRQDAFRYRIEEEMVTSEMNVLETLVSDANITVVGSCNDGEGGSRTRSRTLLGSGMYDRSGDICTVDGLSTDESLCSVSATMSADTISRICDTTRCCNDGVICSNSGYCRNNDGLDYCVCYNGSDDPACFEGSATAVVIIIVVAIVVGVGSVSYYYVRVKPRPQNYTAVSTASPIFDQPDHSGASVLRTNPLYGI